MSLVINHNLMAMNAARNLGNSYNNLSVSVARLSSGLRINSAADDAAGLAIREMMRTDIRVLNQGVRNANDAISLIQTADGALSVVDEKLTRMKELAEQAATGTYTSAQRLIMDSEYQAMASEISRIAMATDFNGVKLLDGSLSGTAAGGVAGSQMKIHFGTGNSSAEDYYYIRIGNSTASALGLGNSASPTHAGYTISTSLPRRRPWRPLMWQSRARTPSGRAWALCPTACPTPSPTCPSRLRICRRPSRASRTWMWQPR